MKKRALMTGASGFIGSHLAKRLKAEGWIVAAVSRASSSSSLRASSLVNDVYEYEGRTEEVCSALQNFMPEVVFHLATLFITEHKVGDVDKLVSSNILLGAQILEAMNQTDTKCLVNAGTSWQNSKGSDYSPLNLYAATKQAFETIVPFYVESSGLKCVTLRLFDSYGPDDRRGKIVSKMVECLHSGDQLQLSPGEQILDLLHIDDLCSAFIHAAGLVMLQDQPGACAYAVSSGERISLRGVASTLERVSGKILRASFGAKPYRDREVMEPWNGPTLPNWRPRIRLEEGLRELVTDYRDTISQA